LKLSAYFGIIKKMDKILILDFGSQYTRLIAKAVRKLGVYSEMLPFSVSWQEVKAKEPKGIILSGGPASVYEKGSPRLDRGIYKLNIPILGICYGMQLIAHDFGGVVAKSEKKEYGMSKIKISSDELFWGCNKEEEVWMSHGDEVKELPQRFEVLASSPNSPYAAIKFKNIYGLQFHPEVHHTPKGKLILENFLKICKVKRDWRPENILKAKLKALKALKGNCIIGVSGGVDSSTAAVLVHKAIGKRLIPIFIDTGLMRIGESERTKKVFEKLGIDLRYVKAKERFFARLSGVVDPEEKRKRIGEEFIRVFEEEALKFEDEVGKIDVFIQGTIYSDVIESAGAWGAAKIKSHHNVGGLPKTKKFKVVEPLRDLFKDEVRSLAGMLGLPEDIIWEQPFPGPGLAVRILGEVTEERVFCLQEVDRIMRDEIRKFGFEHKIWQYFPVLLPLRSVAVVGDERAYGWVVALRAVDSVDGMTADWFRMPYELLGKISSRITSEVEGVTRVVYDITSKPPGTIEWE
jgi:GMP synthase (glutamine-hydrolysing)